MRTGLVASTALHVGLIALAIFGLGIGKPIEATPVESIAVDLVPISDFSNIRMGSLDSTVVETETPSAVDTETPAELARPTGNTTEDQITPQDTPTPTPAPTLETAPAPEVTEPEPAPEPVEAVAPVPAQRPAAAEPVPQPEPTPEPTPEPEPAPTPDTPPVLATDTVTPDPSAAAPKPILKTAALSEKRAQYKKQQEAEKQKKAEQAKAEAEAKKAEEAKKAADAKKKAEEEKKKAEDAKKAADKKKADEAKRIEQAKAAEAAKQADAINDIINNEASRGATTGEGGQKTLGKNDGRSATLSQSQIDGLVGQIRNCIALPAGASELGSEAQLIFSVGGDGSLVGRPQIISTSGDALSDAYARAVSRAVINCGPYAVVAGQDVKATFRARDF